MPTYQYACTSCSHQLEAVQSFADDPLTECPECTGRLRKVFNSVGIVFKGSGFYRTDSRASNTGGKDKTSSNGTSGDSGTSGGSGAEAAPKAKDKPKEKTAEKTTAAAPTA